MAGIEPCTRHRGAFTCSLTLSLSDGLNLAVVLPIRGHPPSTLSFYRSFPLAKQNCRDTSVFRNMIRTRLSSRSFAIPRRPPNNEPGNTRYMNMFLQLDHIPQLHNIYAFISTYILLAGYIVFPGTFTSIRNSSTVEGVAGKSHAGQTVFKAVQNVPLLVIAAMCCVAGVVGMCLLWWIYQDNFIWLRQKIFLFVRFYYII